MESSYIANLSLLSSAARLYREPEVYNELLSLHSLSTGLYQNQIEFNRNCEMTILTNSKWTQKSLEEMRDLTLRCGERLDTPPEGFFEGCNRILDDEDNRAIQLHTEIKEFSDAFLNEITKLVNGINDCIKKVTKASLEVASLMSKLTQVNDRKRALNERQSDLQAKYHSFQQVKDKEHKSRRAEETKIGFSFLTWRETNIVEADFGSADLFREYQAIRGIAKEIESEISDLEKNLTEEFKKHGERYNQEDLKQAAAMLAAALCAARRLENAMGIKKSQSESQINLIKKRLHIQSGEIRIKTIPEAVSQLNLLSDKVLSAHALWIQSHKQVTTIQAIRREETALSNEVMHNLDKLENPGLRTIEAIVTSLNNTSGQEKRALVLKLPTNEQLLLEGSEN